MRARGGTGMVEKGGIAGQVEAKDRQQNLAHRGRPPTARRVLLGDVVCDPLLLPLNIVCTS